MSPLTPPLLMLVASLAAELHAHPSREVVRGIAEAVASEPAPVLGSLAEDAAAVTLWMARESGFQLEPRPWSKDAREGRSTGLLQQAPAIGHLSPYAQVRAWLAQARNGARVCPESPLAPLSGSCRGARGLADRRVAQARELLGRVVGR